MGSAVDFFGPQTIIITELESSQVRIRSKEFLHIEDPFRENWCL
jgi:hypothetical protein